MKVALYQPWIYLHGGLEKSILELVKRSRHHWIIYTGHYEPANTFPDFAKLDVRLLNPTTIKRSIGGTLYSAFQIIRQRIPLDADVDALVVWCDGIGDLAVFRNDRVPVFNICSTPLRAAFDPVYEQLALAGKSPAYRLAYHVFRRAFRFIDRLAWRRFRGIVTTSTEVRNRIVEGNLCKDPSRMLMAYPGIDWHAQPAGITYEPFVLLAGRIMWTKNIQQGIRAFIDAALPAPWKLVVAGFVDAKSHSYLESLRAIVPEGVTVEFGVRWRDDELDRLNRSAAFCLFTPLNEDWGIVPLEAMSRCKAVIANRSGGPLESIESDRTGILVDRDDPAGWPRAVRLLALDPALCLTMGRAAHLDMERFAWPEFVSTVDDCIQAWVTGRVSGAVTPLRPLAARPLAPAADSGSIEAIDSADLSDIGFGVPS
jgi:glycosyltransferase involved in cell wall biosynthesis